MRALIHGQSELGINGNLSIEPLILNIEAGGTVEQAEQLLLGLGGAENITELEPCTTCLRVAVKDPLKADEEVLTACGAFGIVKIGHTVQVVVGPVAEELAAGMEKLR